MTDYGIRPIADDNDEAFKLIEQARIALGIAPPPKLPYPPLATREDKRKDQNGAP